MVKVEVDVDGKPLPCSLYIDGYLKQVLDDANRFQQKNWDVIGFYCGYEGDGKTTKAMQDCLYMDHNFNLSKIVFNAEQFNEVVDSCESGASILWDESDELGGSWQSEMLMAIKRKFKRIRKQRLFIALATPTIFDLNKYFVIHRTRFMIHIYTEGLERGKFRFFNREAKKNLFLKGKKEWNMGAAVPDFFGPFTDLPKGFPVSMEEYEAKKDAATRNSDLNGFARTIPDAIAKKRREYLVNVSRWAESHGVKFKQDDFAMWFGVDRSTISHDFGDLSRKSAAWEVSIDLERSEGDGDEGGGSV